MNEPAFDPAFNFRGHFQSLDMYIRVCVRAEGGRKVNENKLLTMRGSHGKIDPYSTGSFGQYANATFSPPPTNMPFTASTPRCNSSTLSRAQDLYIINQFLLARRCRLCRSSVHQSGAAYCQQCAYKQGICAMCGVKMLDTKNFKMSST